MKNIILSSIVLILITSCDRSKTVKITQEDSKPDSRIAQFDSLYTKLYNDKAFNGNVLVADKGQIIFEKSYGLADEKAKSSLNLNTSFELASVSKQFTAAGIVLLQKEGKLSYDDKLSDYIPEMSAYNTITIHHLLKHTAGLPDYMYLLDKHRNSDNFITNTDVIKLFKELNPEPKFNPGDKWEYSNTGYLLLANIIENVSGLTYKAFLADRIFKPLNMRNTFVHRRWYNPKHIKNSANGYVFSDSLNRKITPNELGNDHYMVFLDGVVGDGMVNSTLHDLLKWDRTLYTERLFNAIDKDFIFSTSQTSDGKENNYGYGWFIKHQEPYGEIVYHSGGWAGFITYFERHVDQDKTIIILQNNAVEKTEIPVKNTRRILYNLPIEQKVVLDTKILQTYAGTYINAKGKDKHILFKDDRLFVELSPEVKLELIPVSDHKFIVDGFSPEVSYTFILDENGKVEKYRVQQLEQGVDKIAIRKSND